MSLSNHQWEFLKDLALLIQYAERRGWKLTGGELWRTPNQQDEYYKAGLTETLNSKHLDRLAIDLNLFKNGKYRRDTKAYQELGEFWESLNKYNRWGGNFNVLVDGNHFERNV